MSPRQRTRENTVRRRPACRPSNKTRHAAAGRRTELSRSGFGRRVGTRRKSALPQPTLRRRQGRRPPREGLGGASAPRALVLVLLLRVLVLAGRMLVCVSRCSSCGRVACRGSPSFLLSCGDGETSIPASGGGHKKCQTRRARRPTGSDVQDTNPAPPEAVKQRPGIARWDQGRRGSVSRFRQMATQP